MGLFTILFTISHGFNAAQEKSIHYVQKGVNGIRQASISGLKTYISPILTLSSEGTEH